MNKEFFYDMIATESVSGSEIRLQKKIASYMKEQSVAVQTDCTGNVICSINESCPFKVLLCGHIDEIGFRVTHITDQGYLRVTKSGGVPISLAPNKRVTVLGRKRITGVMGTLGCRDNMKTKPELTDLFIDCGFTNKEEAMKLVRPGDAVTYTYTIDELQNDCVAGRGLDNRMGAYAVLHALLKARDMGAKVGIYAATTVGEETTMRGAHWAAQAVKPTLAVAVDVTFTTDYPGTNPATYGDISLGKGPVISRCVHGNEPMYQALESAAERAGISVQYEVSGGNSGTDADRLSLTGEGIPTAVVSIPLRYMHGPSEVGSLRDLDQVVDLLAEFLSNLTESFNYDPFAMGEI